MNLVINEQDQICNPQSGFWHRIIKNPTNRTHRKAIHQGYMDYQSNSNCVKKGYFILANQKIIQRKRLKNGAIQCKICDLSWMKFEPYSDRCDNEARFAILIFSDLRQQEFYVHGQTELELWLTKLSHYCINTTFNDDYELQEPIGQGMQAQVYRALSKQNSKIYAVKMQDYSQFLSNQIIIQELIQEISILRNVQHKNILKFRGIYIQDDQVIIVTDFVKGVNCQDIINQSKNLNETIIKKFTFKMLKVLKYLHSRRIVHRDIKPENILVKGKNLLKFKLADFGLSAINSFDQRQKCGTVGFFAPELFTFQGYDEKVDIFSLGMLIFCLQFLLRIAKQNPFIQQNTKFSLQKNKECVIEFKGIIWKLFSSKCPEFLSKLLQKDPNQRPRAIEALRDPWFVDILGGKRYIKIAT